MERIKNYSRIKKNFEKLGLPLVEIPNLLAIQTDSYDRFLQRDIHPVKREHLGLQQAFSSIFPITDAKGLYLLEFIDYSVLKEKYNEEECIARNLSYQAPIKARMRLTVYDEEALKDYNEKRVKDIVQQDVFLGEIPLLTKKGTFIINGAERVIISHLHRSPGVFFTTKKHPSGKLIYSGKVIPNNGSWLEFTLDIYDTMYIHIDKRRKIPVSVLLRSIGISDDEEIRNLFYESEIIKTKDALKRFTYSDIFDSETGEVLINAGTQLLEEDIDELSENEIKEIKVISSNYDTERKIIEQTLSKDVTEDKDSAVKKIYNLIRPGEDPTVEAAEALVERMFFNEKRYNLGVVGRHKLNSRLELNIDIEKHVLTKEDIIAIIHKIIQIVKDKDSVDDIDHLSNRRIRTVGELLQEQYLIGMNRISRIAMERMIVANSDEITVHDLVNSNALIAVIQSFFLTGQLSQFMEETNPLAAITHKRKLSALGPGGLTRERAGFEVRDVHYSHYGRICPIETPEGPNIGLISSPAIYSRINTFGFLETPYIKVSEGKILDEFHYLDATQEDKYTIAQANINISDDRRITDDFVFARRRGEFIQARSNEIDYFEVSPQQFVSVSAALVPFLDHDDANRALMGSNMQRQAVPLLNPEFPRVGTGMERIVARDSGVVARSPFNGIVEKVTSTYVDIKPIDSDENSIDFGVNNRVYLKKYFRTNQDTTLN
ncbi:MAG: DNA-directed RNA polymerase subunit beta, partial [Candidatus Cloacimonadota bacterium]|nr:DNA-directed RNA polymerase subunit beta [Candidatus Cloacimonadota bacterium]